ncbi:MAG: hypothetical protein EOO15_13430 [Chitinophagaceae bacterium]|nr:MAG: hypothetical protein EOO15_13430 [Chitinophagaceae bacterium]
MNLYRAMSAEEWADYASDFQFRTARNTLEGKQFFKTEWATREYVRKSVQRRFHPPYRHLVAFFVPLECIKGIEFEDQILDDFEAITFAEADLFKLSDCVNFKQLDDI